MITGKVSTNLQAMISVAVLGPRGARRIVRTTVDTGFSEFLSLRPQTIKSLRLPYFDDFPAELADGSLKWFKRYEATVIWDKKPLAIQVHEADGEPLAGMSLLEHFRLTAEVRSGGKLTIVRLR
ncbi:MAG TPA: clan AA aspartic protease [Planctomycetota bacterium]|nr:clan AA aspartic protease [Planctomycetota bacterium]